MLCIFLTVFFFFFNQTLIGLFNCSINANNFIFQCTSFDKNATIMFDTLLYCILFPHTISKQKAVSTLFLNIKAGAAVGICNFNMQGFQHNSVQFNYSTCPKSLLCCLIVQTSFCCILIYYHNHKHNDL